MKTKIIAMYLPQYHEIEENNKFWGKGFTDWVSVKRAQSLYDNHRQPRKPLNDNYYDLSVEKNIKWQVDLANEYGVDGFCIYHYWFSSDKHIMETPANIFLNNKTLKTEFMFGWDNGSWVRSWSAYKKDANAWSPEMDGLNKEQLDNGMLIKLEYGNQNDWKIHFDYLLPFFKDNRYIKVDGKPVFGVLQFSERLKDMFDYWNELAVENGFPGVCYLGQMKKTGKNPVFDKVYTYQPIFSAWEFDSTFDKISKRIMAKVSSKDVRCYSYDYIWKKIIKLAKNNSDKDIYYSAFVDYDDTPRRGKNGRVMKGVTKEKFRKNFSELYEICCEQKKELLFVTAWNEWGEGAYLEPDQDNKYSFLEGIKSVVDSKSK